MKRTIIILIGLLLASASAFADDFDEGFTAYQRGDYTTAFSKFRNIAEQGDADAQVNVGWMYKNGEGVPKDYKQAVYWYTKAAEQGNARGQFKLGVMYDNGEGVPRDDKQAVYWYTKSAEQGHAGAQFNLGVMYNNGEGVPKDDKQAVYWFTKAAEQGHAGAQFNVGWMYKNGEGVPRDYKQAVYWYTKAAEQGNADAQSDLGYMYFNGNGTRRNLVLGYMWASLAATQGDNIGIENRDLYESYLSFEQLTEAQRLSREWKPRQQTPQQTPKVAPKRAEESPQLVGTGTGFYVSPEGYVLTNEHVISDCSGVGIEPIGQSPRSATVVGKDGRNDLAVIIANDRGVDYAGFRSRGIRQGEGVVVYGFPLSGALASTGNATTGNVTALAGMNDDSRMLQISAPVQPGNSGGPLMDMSGAVVGVVVSKLDAAKVNEAIGDIPQNVNFALKANVAKSFLESHGIDYESRPKGKPMSVPDVVDMARGFSVRVLCYQ